MKQETLLENEEIISRKQRKNSKKKKKRKIWPSILLAIFAIILVVAALQIPKILNILNTFDNTVLPTESKVANTKGILILGIDNDGGETAETGHTDSITYIGANLDKQKAYALPIYRDANIPVSCTGNNENINRIYAQNGIECLASSTSEFLNLPIDNYVMITMSGFIDIINEFGTLPLTPKETFCSNYGLDKSVSYCFTKGQTEEMTADQAMAYLRYRASGNGEARANRQVEIIYAVKDKCVSDVFACYNKIAPHFSNALKTNINVNDMNTFMDIFSSKFDFDTLSVIEGENVEVTPKNWTQYINEEDKIAKTDIIRNEIFA